MSTDVVERRPIVKALSMTPLLALMGCASAFRNSSNRLVPIANLGNRFRSRTSVVNGARLHYVCGGAGPALLLIHGFPQDWYAFHDVMARLAERYTVIAPDLRGIGGSSGPIEHYDPTTLVRDVLELAHSVGSDSLYVVGHDNGGMLAYSFARMHPGVTRAAFILDVPIPGIEPWTQIKAQPELWHFAFHQTPELPERLVSGRQREYFREFFDRLTHNPAAVTDMDVEHYARAYETIEQLRAGFAFYRQCYPAMERSNAQDHASRDVPLILAGGDHSLGSVNPQIAEALRKHGWRNVIVETIEDCGHWIVDEQPRSVATIIERHARA